MNIYKASGQIIPQYLFKSALQKSIQLRERHPFFQKHRILRRLYAGFILLPTTVFQKRALLLYPFSNKLFVNHIEVVITTHCSLRCKHCANLIQYYEHPYHIPAETVLQEIHQFTKIADHVGRIRILGGEPLLHPKLAEILDDICSLDSLNSIDIVTNGTIIPQNESLKKSLQHPKISLSISDYGINSHHKEELIDYCLRNKIQLTAAPMEALWDDYGNILCRNRTEDELKQQLATCQTRCYSLLKGRLHLCPHSSHGEDLGLFHCRPEEYVNIFGRKSLPEKKMELYKFIYQGPTKISACNFCDNGNPAGMKKVIPGEQLAFKSHRHF